LYPVREQEELAEHLPHATLEVLSAPHGHDSFLIEFDALSAMVTAWRADLDVTPSSRTA